MPPVVVRHLSADEHTGRLAPRSVLLWHTIKHDLERVWIQIHKALRDQETVPRPSDWTLLPRIDCEASTRMWLDEAFSRPAVSVLETTMERVRAGLTEGLDSWFVRAFDGIGRIWAQHQRPCPNREPIHVDTANLGYHLSRNAAFHRAHHSPSDDASSTADPIAEAMGRVKNPRVDIEYAWDTPTKDHAKQGGVPCLVIECKSATKLSADQLESVFHRFDRYCCSPAFVKAWSDGQGIMLRAALYSDGPSTLEPAAVAVLGCLVQLYHAMLRRRQTFGVLSSVHVTLMLKIDWDHATHPGQCVYVATLAAATGQPAPNEPSRLDPRDWNLYHVLVALPILQLEQGLRPVQDFDTLIEQLWLQQESYQSSPGFEDDDSQDDDSHVDEGQGNDSQDADRQDDYVLVDINQAEDDQGSDNQDKVSLGDREAGSSMAGRGTHDREGGVAQGRKRISDEPEASERETRRARPNCQVARSASNSSTVTASLPAAQQTRVNAASVEKLLRTAGKARTELEKLITLADLRLCLPVEPHELGRLLCAIYPLIPPRNPTQAGTQRSCCNESNGESQIVLSPFVIFTSDLLRPRTLDSGPVPAWFNRRLAMSDDPELTRLMAIEAQQQTDAGAHVRTSPEDGNDASNDKHIDDAGPNTSLQDDPSPGASQE